ncbi:MAG: TIGR02444 family protein [Oceanospirillales bacterium]|nr:TIGR02444 family protein [Oceanospirillales bacterium]
MSLNNPLWQSALKLYGSAGVEQAALELQQAGCSINRLLLACYLAQQGLQLESSLLRGDALEWQQAVTHPLRAVRYRVREQKAQRDDLDQCYRALREAELACEQVELMMLWQSLSTANLCSKPSGRELARANLERVLVEAGITDPACVDAPLGVLIAAAFPDPLVSG